MNFTIVLLLPLSFSRIQVTALLGDHFSSSSSGLTVTQTSGSLSTLLKVLVKNFIKCLSISVCLLFSYDWIGVIHLWQERLFCSPLQWWWRDFYPSVTGVAERGAQDPQQFISIIYSQPSGGEHCRTGRASQAEGVRDSLCSNKKMKGPLVHLGWCD